MVSHPPLYRGKRWQLLAVLLAAATWLRKSWTFDFFHGNHQKCRESVGKRGEKPEFQTTIFFWPVQIRFQHKQDSWSSNSKQVLFKPVTLRRRRPPTWVSAWSFPFELCDLLRPGRPRVPRPPRGPRPPRRLRRRRRPWWRRKEAMACGVYNPTGRKSEVQEVQSFHLMSPRCLGKIWWDDGFSDI